MISAQIQNLMSIKQTCIYKRHEKGGHFSMNNLVEHPLFIKNTVKSSFNFSLTVNIIINVNYTQELKPHTCFKILFIHLI